MPDAVSLTAMSMLDDLAQLDVISHNLANANTPGFRRDLSVTERFGTLMNGELGAGVSESIDLLDVTARAHATRATVHEPGTLRLTERPLDVAIEGEGFFALQGPTGPVYSRAGNFSLDATGRMVGSGSLPVLGVEGEIQLGTATPRIDQQGGIWEGDRQVGRLSVVRFADPGSLERIGAGLWSAEGSLAGSESSEDSLTKVRQGYLENSNVSVMHEMVQLIQLMRRFEASQQVIQGYDDGLAQVLRTIGDL